MKKFLSMLALAIAVAGPSMAAGNKANEINDKNKVKTDGATAKNETERAAKLRAEAVKHEAAAAGFQKQAADSYTAHQVALGKFYAERRAAQGLRSQANLLEKDAKEQMEAQKLRHEAEEKRLAADALHRAAYGHALAARSAEAEAAADKTLIADANKAKIPAIAAAAQAELKKDEDRAKAEQAVAKMEQDKAVAMIHEAEGLEKRAAGLERPGVQPPAVIVVKAIAAPPAIQAAVKK